MGANPKKEKIVPEFEGILATLPILNCMLQVVYCKHCYLFSDFFSSITITLF